MVLNALLPPPPPQAKFPVIPFFWPQGLASSDVLRNHVQFLVNQAVQSKCVSSNLLKISDPEMVNESH